MDRLLWTEVSDMGPPNRFQQAMAYDSDRDRVVMFGGRVPLRYVEGGPSELRPQDTWEWDASMWIQMQDMGPPGRSEHALCYDPRRGRTVLFGGAGEHGVLGDTWEWDGELWTQMADDGPPAGAVYALAYDVAHQYVLLFSFANNEHPHGSTWAWDGATWTQLDDAGAGSGTGIMAYDGNEGRILLCTDSAGEPAPQPGPPTFAWTGNAWQQISHLGVHINSAGAQMAFDGKETILYLPGMAQTWSWSNLRWIERQDMGPTRGLGKSMVGDTKRNQCVVFGKESAPGDAPETWIMRRVPA